MGYVGTAALGCPPSAARPAFQYPPNSLQPCPAPFPLKGMFPRSAPVPKVLLFPPRKPDTLSFGHQYV